jgi:hypothetical protein
MRPRGVCAMWVASAIDVLHIFSAPSLPRSLQTRLPRGERGGRSVWGGGFVGGALCAIVMRASRHVGIGMHSRGRAQLGHTAAVMHDSIIEARCFCRGALHAPSWCVRDVGGKRGARITSCALFPMFTRACATRRYSRCGAQIVLRSALHL